MLCKLGILSLRSACMCNTRTKLSFNKVKPYLNTFITRTKRCYHSLGGGGNKGCLTQKSKEIVITDLKTNITSTYISISKAANGIGTSVKSLTKYINSPEPEKLPYLDRYFLTSDKVITTMKLNTSVVCNTHSQVVNNSDKLKIPKAY